MVRDIRKLPRWAQDLIEAQATGLALRWPGVPKPLPDYVARDYALPMGYRNRWIWEPRFGGEVTPLWIAASGMAHHSPESTSFGHRVTGPIFREKSDALLWAWWEAAEKSAATLRDLERAYLQAKGDENGED